jgi:hypothetical protein
MNYMRILAILASAAGFLGAADSKDFRQTVPLDSNGRFSLETYKGSIHVTAWDQPQVEIQARIVEDLGWRPMPVSDVDIRVDSYAGNVRVKTDYRKQWSHNWIGFDDGGTLPLVHYTIRMPRGASLAITDFKSESDISGVQGDVEFNTYKGTARLDGLQRASTLKTYKGDIRAIFVKFAGETHIDTYKGTVDASLPRSSAFDLRTRLERKALFDCDFERTIRTAHHGMEDHGRVNGGGPELRVTSYRGTIRVRST